MKRRVISALGVGLAAAGILAALALGRDTGPQGDGTLRLERVATGLASPVHVTAPRSEPDRLYVVEKGGRIRVLVGGALRPGAFLDISTLVSTGSEQGLLSVAFHPGYARNRRLYVDYTDRNGATRIVEYRSDGTRVLPESARQLYFLADPYSNHNGGQLAFGPDGHLHWGMGDGGSGGDPENRAQNPASPFGKLYRLDVDRRGARPEQMALGLRNPWRFSFDRVTGDLWIGDVGQGSLEEIDFTPRRSPGRENYGWDAYEGRSRFERKRPAPGPLVYPIAQYGRGDGCSVTGGFVYRGRAVPAARGRYFYGDFCTGNVWSLQRRGARGTVRRESFRVEQLSSFGEDARGELYAVSLSGTLYRLA